ncbi:MAG: TRAP transporter TatT component family protein [Wenzhouxiangellaceae bacterium]|nr:TRAP transporter TatT component family protein [Wenzhouxiangellaceae bacterium]
MNRGLGLLLFGCVLLTGCGALVDRATTRFAEDLEAAVVNYDEPLIVERGLPTFLLILEARRQANPNDADLLLSLAALTGTYAGLFVDEPEAERRLATLALDHARQATCAMGSALCESRSLAFETFEARVAALGRDDVAPAFALGSAWVSWIAAHSADYSALAELPRAEALLERVAELDPEHEQGQVWLYLAVLNSQRPPAVGGRPDRARRYFERARELSGGRNLLVDVFEADQLARLVFDRELFVNRLRRVVDAEADQAGFVLANRIAQARARQLLKQTDEIFF